LIAGVNGVVMGTKEAVNECENIVKSKIKTIELTVAEYNAKYQTKTLRSSVKPV
jgi:hypothetical protein